MHGDLGTVPTADELLHDLENVPLVLKCFLLI